MGLQILGLWKTSPEDKVPAGELVEETGLSFT